MPQIHEEKPSRKSRKKTLGPACRLHKASGQAVVTLPGAGDVYLGKYGSQESKARYHRLLAEWEANDRQLPPRADEPITVKELAVRFWNHAKVYYAGRNGRPSTEANHYKRVLRHLVKLYGDTNAADFGPLRLKAIRQILMDADLGRGHVNALVGRIKRVFRWSVAEELIPTATFEALRAVEGLKQGRSKAKESEPVKPVADAVVEATIAKASPVIGAMVRLQQLTGMRPGEVCIMRPAEIEMHHGAKAWVYRPLRHKTMYRGKIREIYLGPKAQAVLKPFLGVKVDSYCFNPADSDAHERARRRSTRKTPAHYGNGPGDNRKRKPHRRPGDCYDTLTYGRAIQRACDRAYPPPPPLRRDKNETHDQWRARLAAGNLTAKLREWQREHRWALNRLRHSFASRVRRDFSLEHAQVALGHSNAKVTEIYAERDMAKAEAVALKIG